MRAKRIPAGLLHRVTREIRSLREELQGVKHEVVENWQQVNEVWPHLQNILCSDRQEEESEEGVRN